MKREIGFYSLAIIAMVAVGCKKEKDTIAPVPYQELYSQIGEPYQGGILAYVLIAGDPGYDPNVAHGIIAAPMDQSPPSGTPWDSTHTYTGATGLTIGAGLSNTNRIVDSVGPGNYAAKICYDLVLGGYNDWFLPSRDELGKLIANADKIGGFNTPSFSANYYWASSEGPSAFEGYTHNFGTGASVGFQPKSMYYHVRAIRVF